MALMLSFHCGSYVHLICVPVVDRLLSVLASSFTCIGCFSCHLCVCHPVPGHPYEYITFYIAFFPVHASSFSKYNVIFPPSVYKQPL